VVLAALKPRGNPLAPGPQPRPADGVIARLRDAGGRPATARVRLFTGLTAATPASLLEDPAGPPMPLADGAATVPVAAAGLATVLLSPADPPWLPGAVAAQPAEALPELAQPVFARYWLHGKGPAPAGNLPVAVHLSPQHVDLSSAGTGQLRLTVAGSVDPVAGEIELLVPPGLDVKPSGPLVYDLPALGHASWELTMRQLPGAAAGHHFVAARITDQAGQLIEDAVLVSAGQPAAGQPADRPALIVEHLEAVAAEADVALASRELRLAPGATGAVEVTVANHAASAIHGEVQLISPFGSWACLPSWAAGFGAAAGDRAVLRFPVAVPADARPGQRWWAIAKVMYFGRCRYSETVQVIIS
jgi:hypothetical protein